MCSMKYTSVNTGIIVTVGVMCLVLSSTGSWAAVLKGHLPPVHHGVGPVEEQEVEMGPVEPIDLDMLLPFEHMDPVDVCLFKCNDCYQVSVYLLYKIQVNFLCDTSYDLDSSFYYRNIFVLEK